MRELLGYSSLEHSPSEKITMSHSHFWVGFATLMTVINLLAMIPLYLSVTIPREKTTTSTHR